MQETSISFYLRSNRVHVFVEALRAIGCPMRICFMLDESGRNLLLMPHSKKDFVSHSVPMDVYNGKRGMEVNSQKLCRILAGINGWDPDESYRVPGVILQDQKRVIFSLLEAEQINHKSR